MAGLTELEVGCGNELVVAIQPDQAKLQRCLGLQSAQLLHKHMTLQSNLLLQIDRAGIEIDNGVKQRYWNRAGPFQDLPCHRTRGLALRDDTLLHHQIVAMQRQLIGTE